MPNGREQYLTTLLGGDSTAVMAGFLRIQRIHKRFDDFEEILKSEWKRYLQGDLQDVAIKKWEPPRLDDISFPPVANTVRPASSPAQLNTPVAQPPQASPPPVPAAASSEPQDQEGDQAMTEKPPKTETQPPDVPTAALPEKTAPAPKVQTPVPQASPQASAKPQPPSPPPALPERAKVSFRLRNGRQSETFNETIAFDPAASQIRLIDVRIPDDLGLTCDLQTGSVTGTPVKNGEYAFAVRYRFNNDPPVAEREGAVSLYVNPDPKLLWKDIESDRTDPLWKDDEASDLVSGDERRIVAARKRGRSHAHAGTCCDDDFFLFHNPDLGWYIAIVADGAGSAKASRHGSRIAVQTAGAYLKEALAGEAGEKVAAAVKGVQGAAEDGLENARRTLHNALYVTVGHAAHRAMKALFDEAQARSDIIGTVKDLSTTLLIGVARKFGSQWLCAAYWVGDGAVGVYRQGGVIELLGEVDAGEYSGQTRFLDANEVSQEALLKRTRFTLCDDFIAFLLMTDGVSDPKFETEARLAKGEAWDALWAELEPIAKSTSPDKRADAELLEWLDFWSQGNHDDRTIAIIY